MTRIAGVALAVACAVVAWAGRAHAMCGRVPFDLAPRDGAVLPRDPTLLLVAIDGLSLEDAGLEVRVDGAPVGFAATAIASGWLVHVTTGGGRELTVEADWVGPRTYPIDPAWRREATRVVDTARVQDQWTCSFTDVVRVAATGTSIGLLVAWGGLEPGAAVIAARGNHDGGMFVDGEDGAELVGAPRYRWFDVGHRDCRPWNIPQRIYEAGGPVEVSAIHADGTIERLGEVALRTDELILPGGQVEGIGEWPPPREVTPAADDARPVRREPVIVLVSVLVIGMVIVMVRRRRRDGTRWVA